MELTLLAQAHKVQMECPATRAEEELHRFQDLVELHFQDQSQAPDLVLEVLRLRHL